ncbi:MAG: DUF1640 domain-containing protein [Magnetococcales bacterium]|nr:DUF1640 domain-containing protein [Magnetococcales bacterium]
MTGLAFDTLRYTKRLREVGVPEPQAEVQAELLAEALADRLATKEDLAKMDADLKLAIKELDVKLTQDIKQLEAKLTQDIKQLEAKLTQDIKQLEAKLTQDIKELEIKLTREIKALDTKIETTKADTIKWTAGMFVAQTALILGAMFAVMRLNQPPPQVPFVQEMRMPTPTQPTPPSHGQGAPFQAK